MKKDLKIGYPNRRISLLMLYVPLNMHEKVNGIEMGVVIHNIYGEMCFLHAFENSNSAYMWTLQR